jgi:hypothetical protein
LSGPGLVVADLLAGSRWLRASDPFPYVVAHDVFTGPVHRELTSHYRSVAARGLSETLDSTHFSRSLGGDYDAYGVSLGAMLPGPLELFAAPQWHAFLNALFGVRGTGHMNIGAHRHLRGGRAGCVHNDFNPVYFPADQAGQIRLPEPASCAYNDGSGPPGARIEVVRAVAMLYFLANAGWNPGDGGETGLYDRPDAAPSRPVVRIAPRDNTLLAFECTPSSWHAFMPNPGAERNCIILWTHRTLDDAVARWSAKDLVRWAS